MFFAFFAFQMRRYELCLPTTLSKIYVEMLTLKSGHSYWKLEIFIHCRSIAIYKLSACFRIREQKQNKTKKKTIWIEIQTENSVYFGEIHILLKFSTAQKIHLLKVQSFNCEIWLSKNFLLFKHITSLCLCKLARCAVSIMKFEFSFLSQ